MTFIYEGLEVRQNEEEIRQLATMIHDRRVLEIGMYEGGLGMYLKREANCSVFGIDMVYHEKYQSIYQSYQIADSKDMQSILFADLHSPYHVVIIDANHEGDYPITDFLNYHLFATEMVVFDDINYPNVRKWFDLVRRDYHSEEIIKQETMWNGLGVIYI